MEKENKSQLINGNSDNLRLKKAYEFENMT